MSFGAHEDLQLLGLLLALGALLALAPTLRVPVPVLLVSVALTGRVAAPSLLVKWTVPL